MLLTYEWCEVYFSKILVRDDSGLQNSRFQEIS